MARSQSTSAASDEPIHLAILGGGAAGCAAAEWAARHGARVTLCNSELALGGTCINVGCVPARTLMHAATLYHRATNNPFSGLVTQATLVDFPALMTQTRKLVESLQHEHFGDMLERLPGVDYRNAHARLISPTQIEVAGERIDVDRTLIATGSAPYIPEIEGLAGIDYLTNESLLAQRNCPASLIFLGTSDQGLMLAQTFSRLGARVIVLEERERILAGQAVDISEVLTASLREEGVHVVTDARVLRLKKKSDGMTEAVVQVGHGQRSFEADRLVFTARRPRSEHLGLDELGIKRDALGFIQVDETLQTNVAGIYAAGDVIGRSMYAYTAAHDASIAAHNAIMHTKMAGSYTAIPFVIYTDPQIACVGWDEAQARSHGFDVDVRLLPLSSVPAARAAYQTRGFVTLIRDRRSDHLIGARVVAAQGADLLMEAAMAIRYGLTVRDLAAMLHPSMTMSDAIRRAALAFEAD
ncbi:MAG: FAD-dependent oxidoreductase [Bradymonadaceae bacterium]|nr:FAD-dependent oxidoreductase [Lujinxingiaceae bacterium]